MEWVSNNIIALVSFVAGFGMGVLSTLVLYFNTMEAKDWFTVVIPIGVSLVALGFARSSARASEASAQAAKKTVKEGYRPLLQLHTEIIKSNAYMFYLPEKFQDYRLYYIYITNIGNRQCKKIEVTVEHALVNMILGKQDSNPTPQDKCVFKEGFLNINKQTRLNKNNGFSVIEDDNTSLTFTITYEELDGTPCDTISFSATLKDLMES